MWGEAAVAEGRRGKRRGAHVSVIARRLERGAAEVGVVQIRGVEANITHEVGRRELGAAEVGVHGADLLEVDIRHVARRRERGPLEAGVEEFRASEVNRGVRARALRRERGAAEVGVRGVDLLEVDVA